MQAVSLSRPRSGSVSSPAGEGSIGHGPLVRYQMHPPITMYPIIYHPHIEPGMEYILGRGPPSYTPIASSSTPHAAGNHPPHPLQAGRLYEALPNIRGATYGRPDGRRQNAYRGGRGAYSGAASHHNHVDVNRIREGIDVRTTVGESAHPGNECKVDRRCRSCSATSPTRLTRPCSNALWMTQAGESTISCI
jgi:hypothetical protein